MLHIIIAFANSTGQYADRSGMRRRLLTALMIFLVAVTSASAADPLGRLIRTQDFSTTLTQIREGRLQALLTAEAVARAIFASADGFSTQERETLLLALLLHRESRGDRGLLLLLSQRLDDLNDWSLVATLLRLHEAMPPDHQKNLAQRVLDRYLDLPVAQRTATPAAPALLAAFVLLDDAASPAVVESAREVARSSGVPEVVEAARSLARSVARNLR